MIPRSAGIETRRKVLLVDDDAVSLELMALLIAHEGHQVVPACGAEAALEVLATEKACPDVLLVDLQMPGVSGGQLAERVRAIGGPGLLLLAMSATEVQRQQLRAFDGFLLKPLAVDDLRRALKPGKAGRSPRVRFSHPRSVDRGTVAVFPAKPETVDMAVIGKLLTMMPIEALHDVVAACIADTRGCVETLKYQLRNGDETGVRQSAHRIKGAALMIGASRLAGLAAGLETGGGEPAATPGVLDDLVSACSELERMLLAGKLKKT